MKRIKTLLFSLSALALLAVGSCKKEKCQDPQNPQCENYDPCFGKRTINTFFKVRPGDRGFPPPPDWCELIPTDTFNEISVRFDIPDNSLGNSTFSWQIGTEAQPRTSKAFEVNFGDYLDDNGWEKHIPVSLTIRTPLNACLKNPADTLITVTRYLFFTSDPETKPDIFKRGKTRAKFKGYYSSNPDKLATLEFIKAEEWPARDLSFAVTQMIGLPGLDTLLMPDYCPFEACGNYLHFKAKFRQPRNCGVVDGRKIHDLTQLTNYILELDMIFPAGNEKVRFIWLSDKPTGLERLEFTGDRIE